MVGRVAVWWLAALLASSPVLAKTPEERRVDTLRALPGVYFIVEPVGSEAEADGLSTELLIRDVELRLRQAGVHILSEGEWARAPGRPFLYIRVSLVKSGSRYVYHLGMELLQRVRLERYQELPSVQVPTWTAPEEIGLLDADRLGEIRTYVLDQLALFIRAYLTVNAI